MTTTENTEPAILMRVKITRAEFDALRIAAIHENVSTPELIARALRSTYLRESA